MRRIFPSIFALLSVLVGAGVSAQPTCELPVSAYLSDGAGAGLDGTLDVELRFFVDSDPGAPPTECRSFLGASVTRGWLRVGVDVCSPPDAADCGSLALADVLRSADGLWVAVVVDGEELGPRLPVGAVPYAVEAANSGTLQGRGPEAFEASGSIDTHAANADAHHSSTSDGIAITPLSVTVGETEIESGSVDLGPEVADELTAEIVETLTGGGEADALHGHSAGGAGGGGCYVPIGITTCATGYTVAYTGVFGDSMGIYSNSITASPLCIADAAIDSVNLVGGDPTRRVYAAGGSSPRTIQTVDDYLLCALCCP